MGKGVKAKAKCRQESLCGRKHVTCDLCHRQVHGVKAIGRDSNGDHDAPDACIVCERWYGSYKAYATGRDWWCKPKTKAVA
jgi:hypothetical protein